MPMHRKRLRDLSARRLFRRFEHMLRWRPLQLHRWAGWWSVRARGRGSRPHLVLRVWLRPCRREQETTTTTTCRFYIQPCLNDSIMDGDCWERVCDPLETHPGCVSRGECYPKNRCLPAQPVLRQRATTRWRSSPSPRRRGASHLVTPLFTGCLAALRFGPQSTSCRQRIACNRLVLPAAPCRRRRTLHIRTAPHTPK